jgi:hypothetical protein
MPEIATTITTLAKPRTMAIAACQRRAVAVVAGPDFSTGKTGSEGGRRQLVSLKIA